MTRRLGKLGRLQLTCAAVGLGIAATASVAYAATFSVTSARLTTSTVAASIGETTCTLTPTADAALDRSSQGTNYGSVAFLSVRSQSGNNQRRSIARFDIASCNIPAGALVRSASLSFTVSTAPGSSRTYGVHRVTGSWTEATVTYQNQPAFTATATSTVATGAAPTSLSWSVLSDVSAFVAGTATNNGWLVKDATEGSSPAVETLFPSRESATPANRPVLVIGYYP
jgi:hypothetical protein